MDERMDEWMNFMSNWPNQSQLFLSWWVNVVVVRKYGSCGQKCFTLLKFKRFCFFLSLKLFLLHFLSLRFRFLRPLSYLVLVILIETPDEQKRSVIIIISIKFQSRPKKESDTNWNLRVFEIISEKWKQLCLWEEVRRGCGACDPL